MARPPPRCTRRLLFSHSWQATGARGRMELARLDSAATTVRPPQDVPRLRQSVCCKRNTKFIASVRRLAVLYSAVMPHSPALAGGSNDWLVPRRIRWALLYALLSTLILPKNMDHCRAQRLTKRRSKSASSEKQRTTPRKAYKDQPATGTSIKWPLRAAKTSSRNIEKSRRSRRESRNTRKLRALAKPFVLLSRKNPPRSFRTNCNTPWS